jgi:hypothetical protein
MLDDEAMLERPKLTSLAQRRSDSHRARRVAVGVEHCGLSMMSVRIPAMAASARRWPNGGRTA